MKRQLAPVVFVCLFSANALHSPVMAIPVSAIIEESIHLPVVSYAVSTHISAAPVAARSNIEQLVQDIVNNAPVELRNTRKKAKNYLPYFSNMLQAQQLPDNFKLIAVVESRLIPNCKSSAGAAGLWQLMPKTARSYGLEVSDEKDERYDLTPSTKIATKHLRHLMNTFNDELLVVAAYNTGEYRVKKALQQQQTTSYWDIHRILPNQTQQYIYQYLAWQELIKK